MATASARAACATARRSRFTAGTPTRTASIPHSAFVYDDGETLYALEQWGYRSNRFEYVLLPTDKACIFTHDQEGANFWGIPLTRAMYPHWFVKKHLERIDAIACERNSLGVPMIMLPPNPSRQDVQTAQNWVTQLAAHEKTGLSLPNGAEFKLVGIEGRIREILPSLQYHKQQIATSCLAMFMELGQTATGSRALGDSQTDFFLLATQNTADYIAHQIRNSTIRRLVQWNSAPTRPCPTSFPPTCRRGQSIRWPPSYPTRAGGRVDLRPLEREPGAARIGL